jgi:NAD(P)-dependent dehydrogenase (short-subunit alcohol dehydrogenase family)
VDQIKKFIFLCARQFSGMDRDQRLEWLWRSGRETFEAAKEALQTNYYGTKHVIEAILPLLQASSDGRICNISSDFGQLRVPSFDHTVPIQPSMLPSIQS